MATTTELRARLEAATGGLPTDWKKMFGCDAAFARSNIFALVWKEGRIGVKLPDEKSFKALMGTAGSSPWSPGGPGKKMTMAHWVLVPERLHDRKAELARWVRQAHELAMKAPPKAQKKAAKKTAKKTVTKR